MEFYKYIIQIIYPKIVICFIKPVDFAQTSVFIRNKLKM